MADVEIVLDPPQDRIYHPSRPRKGGLMTASTQPGCTGMIVDDYCGVCGSPAGAAPFVAAGAAASAGAPRRRPGGSDLTGGASDPNRASGWSRFLSALPSPRPRFRGRSTRDRNPRRPRRIRSAARRPPQRHRGRHQPLRRLARARALVGRAAWSALIVAYATAGLADVLLERGQFDKAEAILARLEFG